jgi:hypothetical protein
MRVPPADLRAVDKGREPVSLGHWILDRLFNPRSWLSGRRCYEDGVPFAPLRKR